MEGGKSYLKIEKKVEMLFSKILEQGPLSTVMLIEIFQKEGGLTKSTARSSVSQVLREMLDLDVLKVVGYRSRGVRVIDVSPHGFWAIIRYLALRHRDKPLWENKLGYLLGTALERMKHYSILGFACIYHELSREIPTREVEEEVRKMSLYDFIVSYVAFDEPEDIPSDWAELEEVLEDKIVEELIDILKERGGVSKIKHIIDKIRAQYKASPFPHLKDKDMQYYLMQVLEAASDETKQEIDELRRVEEKIQSILEELKKYKQ